VKHIPAETLTISSSLLEYYQGNPNAVWSCWIKAQQLKDR